MKRRPRQQEIMFPRPGQSPRPPAIRAYLADDEIYADNFAGGGGASSGMELALGRSPDIAINHDPEAIAMHRANHPRTKHYNESVWDVDPRKACAGRRVALAWFSPDCKHHSKAKGGKPRDQKIRGLAWSAVRWAHLVKPRVIALENVEEFEHWGPLHRDHVPSCAGNGDDVECKRGCSYGMPIKARKGQTFRQFVEKLRRLGYVVEWRILRACDYGAPTMRRRLFLVARRDGLPITWPAPTHGPGREQPHRSAAECIDWTIACPSIFDRTKPLADKTLARLARGTHKFVLESPRPFIIPPAYGDKGGTDIRCNDIDEPLRTICGNRGVHAVATPFVVKAKTHGGGGNEPKSGDEPLGTITASKRGEFAVAVPYLIHRSNGERPGQAPRIYDPSKPLGTVVAQGEKHAACVATLIKHNGGNNDAHGSSGQPLDRPCDTISARDSKSLMVAHLARYNSENSNGSVRGQTLEAPMSTLDAANRFGLVSSHLVKLRGTSEAHIDSSASSLEAPVPTISAGGTHVAQVSAFLVRYNGESEAQPIETPIGTLMANDTYAVVDVELDPTHGLDPETLAKARRVASFLREHGYEVDDVATVTIEGETYVVVDIGMRMLSPRELFRAQGFGDDYEIAPTWNGKPLTRTAQVRMVGNSVCPPVAAAVVRAQFEPLEERAAA